MSYVTDILLFEGNSGSNSASDNNSTGKGSSPAIDVVQTHPGLDARKFLVLLKLPLREHPIQTGILNTGLFSGTAKER